MMGMLHLKRMVGLTDSDEALIGSRRELLLGELQRWEPEFESWLRDHTSWPLEGPAPLLDDYFASFASGSYDDAFHRTQYQQSLHWLMHGMQPSQVIAALSSLRQFFIEFAETNSEMDLARSLCRVVDISQSIQAMVSHLEHQLTRLRQDAERDIQRLRITCRGVVPEDDELMRSYVAHYQWKVRAYALALGEPLNDREHIEDHHHCVLGRWLDSGGIEVIPRDRREALHASHRRLHELMNLVLEKARDKQPLGVAQYLADIEAASTEITGILGGCLDRQVQRMAVEDGLTGLPNKRMYDQDMQRLLSQANRRGHGFGVLFIDIDHFKNVNDSYGHATGDRVIQATAGYLKDLMRGGDRVFRWGGEEFIALIHADTADEVSRVAERLRTHIEKRPVAHDGTPLQITVSIGAAWCDPQHPCDAATLFGQVDQRLHQAKRDGRNRVVFT